MAKYSRGVIVFCVGMFVISLWCMSEASGHEEAVPAGCNNKHSDAGEQCIDEDDTLGLYNDIDDTFKTAKKMAHKAAHHFHETVFGDNDDSPDVAHNNVDVLGH